MYLKKAPASSVRATLWCGMSWGHGEPEGCISSLSCSIFHRDMAVAKFQRFVWLHIGEIVGKVQNKKVSPCIFLSKFKFRYLYELLNNPKWLIFSEFFDLATHISIFTFFFRTNMRFRIREFIEI